MKSKQQIIDEIESMKLSNVSELDSSEQSFWGEQYTGEIRSRMGTINQTIDRVISILKDSL